jgi:hypothetical protein
VKRRFGISRELKVIKSANFNQKVVTRDDEKFFGFGIGIGYFQT